MHHESVYFDQCTCTCGYLICLCARILTSGDATCNLKNPAVVVSSKANTMLNICCGFIDGKFKAVSNLLWYCEWMAQSCLKTFVVVL